MAINVPIWPGSSSFFPGDTPFGFYDHDFEFQMEADKIASGCARKLGFPLCDDCFIQTCKNFAEDCEEGKPFIRFQRY